MTISYSFSSALTHSTFYQYNLDTLSKDHTGKTLPERAKLKDQKPENHALSRRTYLYSPYMGVFPPLFGTSSHLLDLTFLAVKQGTPGTSIVYFVQERPKKGLCGAYRVMENNKRKWKLIREYGLLFLTF